MTGASYEQVQNSLRAEPQTWLITGVAGFIGSNLLENLLKLDQRVCGLDNFATGHQHNLDDVRSHVSAEQWARFEFVEGDICNEDACQAACKDADIVLHQAALGSVPRSIADPLRTHHVNLTGFLNMLVAARDAGVNRFVYAASSSTYGDHPDLPKVEDRVGRPLSPYAVTKFADELYADVFPRAYGVPVVGLRYFNVFGPRQDANGAYAAVIPKWFAALLGGGDAYINGDGETSRDFCFIENCVQANLLAATMGNEQALGQVFNVAFGERTTLNELFALIKSVLVEEGIDCGDLGPVHREFRAGDVRHSLADIGKAQRILGYRPDFSVHDGLRHAARWYMDRLDARALARERQA